MAVLATPDAGYAASSSQPTFAPQRYPENEERYVQQDQRPSYNYRRPSSEYQEIPNESSSIRRRVDPTLQAVSTQCVLVNVDTFNGTYKNYIVVIPFT